MPRIDERRKIVTYVQLCSAMLIGFTGPPVHDNCRTGSTNIARLGIAPHVGERVFNHMTGELGGIAGVYDVYGYLREKRAAIETWAKCLKRLVKLY